MAPETPRDMYQGFRQKWLGGEMVAIAPSDLGPEEVIAVLMEFRTGNGSATLVGAADGTASLYLDHGGGIIGMGFHAPTVAAGLAWVGCARSYVASFPTVTSFPIPEQGRRALRIVTRAGIHSAEISEDEIRAEPPTAPIAPLAIAAEHLLTNARLLDERRRRDGIRSHFVDVQVFADGGACVLVPPMGTGTWLTAIELKRVLAVAKTHDDRLRVYVEPGEPKLQKLVLDVIAQSGLSRAQGAAPRLLGYSGGTTTLLYAVEDARLDLVEEIVQRGVSLEAQDARGYTALILAAYRGRNSILRLLAQAGANVDARDRHGNSVLLFAAQYGDREIVKLLVEAGADPNVRGQNGYTALRVAKLTGHAEAALFLESKGADE